MKSPYPRTARPPYRWVAAGEEAPAPMRSRPKTGPITERWYETPRAVGYYPAEDLERFRSYDVRLLEAALEDAAPFSELRELCRDEYRSSDHAAEVTVRDLIHEGAIRSTSARWGNWSTQSFLITETGEALLRRLWALEPQPHPA